MNFVVLRAKIEIISEFLAVGIILLLLRYDSHNMDLESQNIEYKQSRHDEYLKWVCGFANAQGGRIYIGKDDNGATVGVEDAKRLSEDIPNKIRNYLGITCEVNLLVLRAKIDNLFKSVVNELFFLLLR